MLYFTHLPGSPQWMDFYQIWYRRSPRGCNQLCWFFCRSVQGYWFCGGLIFAYPHRNWRSPLTLPELPFRLWYFNDNTKSYPPAADTWPIVRRCCSIQSRCWKLRWCCSCSTLHRSQCTDTRSTEMEWMWRRHRYNKNLAIANRSRVSCAHNTLRISIGLNSIPWPWNLG